MNNIDIKIASKTAFHKEEVKRGSAIQYVYIGDVLVRSILLKRKPTLTYMIKKEEAEKLLSVLISELAIESNI